MSEMDYEQCKVKRNLRWRTMITETKVQSNIKPPVEYLVCLHSCTRLYTSLHRHRISRLDPCQYKFLGFKDGLSKAR